METLNECKVQGGARIAAVETALASLQAAGHVNRDKSADPSPRQGPRAAFGGTSRQVKLSKDAIDLTKE
eukprot:181365-Pyramimonas_sp.AAC.1